MKGTTANAVSRCTAYYKLCLQQGGIILLLLFSTQTFAQQKPAGKKANGFLWGVATAAYQVEGAYKADGKGESKWDFLTNTVGVTRFMTGRNETGNVSINMYDRTQYLKDIALMKKLGVNAYRFSVDWSRIIPDGTGAVNEKALAHYDRLIDDVKAAGLEPVVTLYHFNFPLALFYKGGWGNPEMINWYTNYASIVVKRYGKKVKKFITFNEPYIEFFVADYLGNVDQSKDPATVRFSKQMIKAHRQLLASAMVTKLYHSLHLGGSIGITFNLSPCIPYDAANPEDIAATGLQDQLLNRMFLDAVLKGTYPQQAVDSIQKYDPSFRPSAEEMNLLAAQKPDFLGVNFYAPALVKGDKEAPLCTTWMGNNKDSVKMNNGPVKPEYLYQLLLRIKNEYNNPPTIITENGASFSNGEDTVINGKVADRYRADYIQRHIAAALRAKKEGANLQGYFVWSGWDNFEWVFGYSIRFGIIYVDYKTMQRTPKQSYYTYQKIIQQQHL